MIIAKNQLCLNRGLFSMKFVCSPPICIGFLSITLSKNMYSDFAPICKCETECLCNAVVACSVCVMHYVCWLYRPQQISVTPWAQRGHHIGAQQSPTSPIFLSVTLIASSGCHTHIYLDDSPRGLCGMVPVSWEGSPAPISDRLGQTGNWAHIAT